MTSPGTVPDACAIAFKEWAGVCDALAGGRQVVILRKGGIAEGRGGFAPEHPAFWLYPTFVHEAEQGLKPDEPAVEPPPAGIVPIRTLAVVESVRRVESLERLGTLSGQHAWTDATVAKRFHYREPGLWVLLVRAWNRPEPAMVPVTPEHAGCRTWVPLEGPPEAQALAPALDDDAFARMREAVNRALGTG